MSKQGTPNLVESICEGQGNRFHGAACEFYAQAAKECALLKGQQLQEFWDRGRCAYTILRIVEDGCVKALRELYGDLIWDDAFDYDMQGVVERLRQQELTTGFSLPVWHRYVHTTVYRELKRRLITLPDKKICGTCKHLSKSTAHICELRREIHPSLRRCPEYQAEPGAAHPAGDLTCLDCLHLSRKAYFCYLLGEKRNKTSEICEEYSLDIATDFISLNQAAANEGEPQQSHQLDRLHYEINQADGSAEASDAARLSATDELLHIQALLQERIDTAAAGSKRREIYARQYEHFFAFALTLSDAGLDEDEAIRATAAEYGLKEWTLRRDIRDAREFLSKIVRNDAPPASSEEKGGEFIQ